MFLKSTKSKVGLNALANTVSVLNGKISLHWLMLSPYSFKIKFKTVLLKFLNHNVNGTIKFTANSSKFGVSKLWPFRSKTKCTSYSKMGKN